MLKLYIPLIISIFAVIKSDDASFIGVLRSTTSTLTQSNDGPWGEWSITPQYCKPGTYAKGFRLLNEAPQGAFDDTAVNGIGLLCADGTTGIIVDELYADNSNEWGEWTPDVVCPARSFIIGFDQSVEPDQGHGDDTALTNIKIKCSSGDIYESDADINSWGQYTNTFVECSPGSYVCGFNQKVEYPVFGDDTGMNALELYCCISQGTLIQREGDYLYEPSKIDLRTNGSSVILYVRLCQWSLLNSTGSTIVNMTRYCYCSNANIYDVYSCSFPGPTLLMQNNTNINVTIVNQLNGSNILYNSTTPFWNKYKDMDITNLHVHGLHVSPFIDDVLLYMKPNNDSHSYLYSFVYHYPGTFWYHAHHHGSTTWQVNMGLHGAILMHNPVDDISDKYEENILMFDWMYIVPEDVCNKDKCGADDYTPRFHLLPSSNTETVGSDYSMCDVYCQFPSLQRDHSGYRYDVKTDLVYNDDPEYEIDYNLLHFFVNGQLSPIIKLRRNIFRRLRLINSLSNWFLQFKFPDECQWYLIATDGIYIGSDQYMNYNLSNISHQNNLLLSPGGRADVMVKCVNIGTYNIYTSNSTEQDETLKHFTRIPVNGRVLFSVEVEDEDKDDIVEDGTDELPKAYPAKPPGTYIEDLQNTSPQTNCPCNYDDINNDKCHISFAFINHTASINEKPFNITYNKPYNGTYLSDSLTIIEYDEAYEFVINNNGNRLTFNTSHVYHQHINPFQVETFIGENGFIALPQTWWDTLGNVPITDNDNIRARLWSRDFDGLIITHCHLLQHEDIGMMGFYNIIKDAPKAGSCPNQN